MRKEQRGCSPWPINTPYISFIIQPRQTPSSTSLSPSSTPIRTEHGDDSDDGDGDRGGDGDGDCVVDDGGGGADGGGDENVVYNTGVRTML